MRTGSADCSQLARASERSAERPPSRRRRRSGLGPSTTKTDFLRNTRARDLGIEAKCDEGLEVATKVRLGHKRKETSTGYGFVCPACQQDCEWQSNWRHSDDKSPLCEGVLKPERHETIEIEVTYGDMVDRARLTVDYIKWYAGKIAPKRYGTERTEIKSLQEIDWDTASPELLDKVADHLLAKAFPRGPGTRGRSAQADRIGSEGRNYGG